MATDGGFVVNGLRVLIGSPVFYYAMNSTSNNTEIFLQLKQAD